MPLNLPMPSFEVNTPQIANPLDTQAKMLQLKNLSGQQQLLPLQIQEQQEKVKQQQIATQQARLEQQSQQAMMKAWSDPKFTANFTGTQSANDSGLGFDPDSMTRELISRGVTPKDAFGMSSQFMERSQKIATTLKDQAQTGEAQAATRDKGYKVLSDRIAGVLDMSADKAADALTQLKQDLVKNPQAFAGVPQEDLAHVYGADLEHLPAMASMIGLDAKIADFHKSKAEAAAAQQKVIPPGGGLSPDTAQQVQKEVTVATNPKIQAGKEAVAAAEGKQRQLTEGAAQPVYAMDAQGNKQLMSKADAIQGGYKTILPVTEKQVGEDTMLINRLGDVRQKIARYDQALQLPVTSKDQSNIAALIGKQSFKVGAFGTELPVDRLNAALDKENIEGLSPNAKKLLISYYNARESMSGYQRVLTGTGRSSDKNMELQLDALPNPGTADADYARESLKQFRENLNIVGQGLPRIPGVKTPEEIEQQALPVKTATRQHIADYAKQKGISVQEAEKQAKAAGYTIQ